MALTFRYQKEEGEYGEAVFRPKILVTLFNKGIKTDAIALIDSGSDIVFLPATLANMLELEQGEKIPIKGLSVVDCYETRLNISFGKSSQQITYRNVPAAINPVETDDTQLVLGLALFHEFDVTFKQQEKKIIFKEAKPLSQKLH